MKKNWRLIQRIYNQDIGIGFGIYFYFTYIGIGFGIEKYAMLKMINEKTKQKQITEGIG